MKILVVEDDHDIAEMVRDSLSNETHIVDIADTGTDGSFLARSYTYDIIILDNSLPKKDGLTICKEIRGAGKTTPILFLSINSETNTKVLALESGADDYMTKPFSMSELKARIKALARRAPQISSHTISVHDLEIDTNTKTATRKSKPVRLTKKEFSLLEYMMKNKGVTLSRSAIMEHVWSSDSDPLSNTVEAHIRNLRKKINANDTIDLIHNRPGHGYVLDTPENIAKL